MPKIFILKKKQQNKTDLCKICWDEMKIVFFLSQTNGKNLLEGKIVILPYQLDVLIDPHH